MKEQYQKEISQIHVPVELLEKTKLAMQEEKSGKVISFKRISIIAAAAVVLLVVAPMTSYILYDNGKDMDKTQMYLGEQEDKELHAISPQKSWIEELVDTIKDFLD